MNLNYNISNPDLAVLEYITLDVAKAHLKIDYDYEDDLITQYIISAITMAEEYTGLYIYQRQVKICANSFPNSLVLEYTPVLDKVFTVNYFDETNTELEYKEYRYNGTPASKDCLIHDSSGSFPETYDRIDAVSFSYVVGMTQKTLPEVIYQAILLMVSDFYEFRTDRSEIVSTRAQALMRPFKKFI
ncbi:head-tail connector protein [Aquimarina sp. 2201CG14-23]|uniref:head-tail connector protein n=1 Tax=Aquimarina mycalae TaxID=3040073 RepID=UPI0024782292|nr:head-tail connector protein [Aquimarina sp. 2201CG14-23]MDH7444673.1 head-tail connector protein [Aquimarina sp. 2201CG14-23]